MIGSFILGIIAGILILKIIDAFHIREATKERYPRKGKYSFIKKIIYRAKKVKVGIYDDYGEEIGEEFYQGQDGISDEIYEGQEIETY